MRDIFALFLCRLGKWGGEYVHGPNPNLLTEKSQNTLEIQFIFKWAYLRIKIIFGGTERWRILLEKS